MDLDRLERCLQERVPGMMDATGRYAVLVPLVQGEDGLSLLYEVRARSMKRQPGEVCFPGGRMERGETAQECALRETQEELGIPASAIRVLGQLDFLAHRANFIMYPVLALVERSALDHMTFSRAEVDETFLVPLRYLQSVEPVEYSYELIPKISEDFPYEQIGISRDYPWRFGRESGPVYPWGEHPIWGLTGKITRHLLRVMQENEI